jgi:mono/diheme cytochrome c family protein
MTRFNLRLAATIFTGMALASAGGRAAEVDTGKLPPPSTKKPDFERDIQPIFQKSCVKCHGPEKQRGEYRMDTKEGAFKKHNNVPVIVRGNSEKSRLIQMVAGLIEDDLMPPPGKKPGEDEPLTSQQIGLLRAWIDQGANWPEPGGKEAPPPIDYAKDIEPIFKAACYDCHGPAQQKGGFRADSKEALLKGGKSYGKVIVPENSAKSTLINIVSGKDEDIAMPEKHKLPPGQVALLKNWIEQGAK